MQPYVDYGLRTTVYKENLGKDERAEIYAFIAISKAAYLS